MNVNYVNKTTHKIPKDFLKGWLKSIEKNLKGISGQELTIMFVGPSTIRSLNKKFRDKDYATDILTFGSLNDPMSIPELVICPQVLKKQAKDHDLSFNFELGYLTLHGILHLLGYDHEQGGRQAKRMYDLQDRIYQKISKKLK